MDWFKRYWPWLSCFLFLIAYELYAIATHHPTLSQMVWRAQIEWSGLVWVVLAVVGVLLAHFFIRKRKP